MRRICNPTQSDIRTCYPGYRVKRGMTYARASIKTGVPTPLQSRQSVAVIPQKCGIQKKASYPADVHWIPRQARYDDLTPRGGDAKRQECPLRRTCNPTRQRQNPSGTNDTPVGDKRHSRRGQTTVSSGTNDSLVGDKRQQPVAADLQSDAILQDNPTR